MKQNFSDFDFKKVSSIFNGNLFNVRFNKACNIQLDVKDLSKFNVPYWSNRCYTFYNTPDGIIIRCRSWKDSQTWGVSVFPLNMNYDARHIQCSWEDDNGITHTYYGFSIKKCAFENLDDAIVYFIEYLNIYHNIINF